MTLNRRTFLKTAGLALGAASLGLPRLVLGASPKVVIVGGGTAGASVARYLRRADPDLGITLIEPNPIYHTCYGSNEVLSGTRPIAGIQVGYENLSAAGIDIVQARVTGIDPAARTLSTDAGTTLTYDRCVVAPGIDFKWDQIDGYDAAVAERIPHAWKAGDQTSLLRAQLQAMDDGGTVIVAAPDNPFRCPPGPYERVSQIAMYLKAHKPASKILLLDHKSAFAKQAAFELAWERLYGYNSADSLIDWLPADGVVALDEAAGSVTTADGLTYTGDVINLIPNQTAGAVAHAADLTDGDWAPVDLRTFESTRHPFIHVLGDASVAGALPKSGYAANAEAKACAAAVAAQLRGEPLPSPAYANTCYSVVGEDYGISVVTQYRLSEDGTQIQPIGGGTTPLDASTEDLRREAAHAHAWYRNFVGDVFG